MNHTPKLAALATVFFAAISAASASDWRWSVTPYAWATDVGIDLRVDERQLVDETIPVEDLLEDLDTTAQLRLEAQKGAHGVFVDLFDVTLSDDPKSLALPSGNGTATFSPEMGMTLVDLGGLYDPSGDQAGLQLLYGARILDQRATIGAEVELFDGQSAARDFASDETTVDALVGLRYSRRLGARFSFLTLADLSTGGTALTWSAGLTLGYGFGATRRFTALVGYRRMVVDFATADDVDAEMTLSGAVAGLRIDF